MREQEMDIKEKPIKLMQLRIPMAVYDKIRERAYVERRTMQSIVLELFEREFVAEKES